MPTLAISAVLSSMRLQARPRDMADVDAVASRMRIDFDEAERRPQTAPNVARLSTACFLSGSSRRAATLPATSDVDIATKSVDGGLADLT